MYFSSKHEPKTLRAPNFSLPAEEKKRKTALLPRLPDILLLKNTRANREDTLTPHPMESPARNKPTSSRVIDSLHSQIDELKAELEHLRLSQSEHKKNHAVLASKHESLVDQLANAKHENDMVNALLKRKERRIADLEEDTDKLSAANDSLRHGNANLKIRCEQLQDSSALSTAEYERLKIAYDALLAAQNEYKRHYQSELAQVAQQFEEYKQESRKQMAELSSKLDSNDKDIDTLLDGLVHKRKVMDNLYVNRNRTVLELLAALSRAAKAHGEESRELLAENICAINLIREKFPDLQEKISEHNGRQIDIDDLLSQTSASFDTSVDELEQGQNTGHDKADELRNMRTPSVRRRKHKRNSMRVSPEAELSDALPRARPHQEPARTPELGRRPMSQQDLLARNSLSRSTLGGRNSPRPQSSGYSSYSGHTSQSNTSHRLSHNAKNGRVASTGSGSRTPSGGAKRRLFYGGSNNYNNGSNRRSLGKADTSI